jgi:hypothetical protein
MSIKKVNKGHCTFSFVLLIGTSAAMAADKPVLTVGTSTLDEKEVLNLMATTTGGNQMMVGLMLAQSTLPERVDLVNQMAHALLFAEAAKQKALIHVLISPFRSNGRRCRYLCRHILSRTHQSGT